jgi:hypothetical protein
MDAQLGSISEPTIIDKLRAQLAGIFSIALVDVPKPPDNAIRFRGYLQQEPEQAFAELSRRFEPLDYTPTLSRDEENGGQDVLVAVRGVARPKPSRAWINLVLFGATVFTTLLAGSFYEGGGLLSVVPFAFTLLLILGTHEFGHYFVARYHRAAVTLPYFIPFPSLPGMLSLGTMGAVIQLRSPIRDRKQLFDIGVAGPLAGLVVAIPLLILGLSQSPVSERAGRFDQFNGLRSLDRPFCHLPEPVTYGTAGRWARGLCALWPARVDIGPCYGSCAFCPGVPRLARLVLVGYLASDLRAATPATTERPHAAGSPAQGIGRGDDRHIPPCFYSNTVRDSLSLDT